MPHRGLDLVEPPAEVGFDGEPDEVGHGLVDAHEAESRVDEGERDGRVLQERVEADEVLEPEHLVGRRGRSDGHPRLPFAWFPAARFLAARFLAAWLRPLPVGNSR